VKGTTCCPYKRPWTKDSGPVYCGPNITGMFRRMTSMVKEPMRLKVIDKFEGAPMA
jgi:hypothetical protein